MRKFRAIQLAERFRGFTQTRHRQVAWMNSGATAMVATGGEGESTEVWFDRTHFSIPQFFAAGVCEDRVMTGTKQFQPVMFTDFDPAAELPLPLPDEVGSCQHPTIYGRTVVGGAFLKVAAPRAVCLWRLSRDTRPQSAELRNLPGHDVYGWGIDGTGRLIARIDEVEGRKAGRVVIWDDTGTLTRLDMGGYQRAGVILAAGHRIAAALDDGNGAHALARWTDEQLHLADSKHNVTVDFMNAGGDVIGTFLNRTGPPTGFIWFADEERPQVLAAITTGTIPGGAITDCEYVTDNGEIVVKAGDRHHLLLVPE